MKKCKQLVIALVFVTVISIYLLNACQVSMPSDSIKMPPQPLGLTQPALEEADQSPTPTLQSRPFTWWFDPSLDQQAVEILMAAHNPVLAVKRNEASIWVRSQKTTGLVDHILFSHMLVISAPFARFETSIQLNELNRLIANNDNHAAATRIWINSQDYSYLAYLYPQLNPDNFLISDIYPPTCETQICYRIQSLEASTPEWRILAIDGNSPLHSDFTLENYPLIYYLVYEINPDVAVSNDSINKLQKINNYHPEKLTSLLMTGTTALVRHTALQMEEFGILFPLENLGTLLNSADITHVSNEVPFYTKCPPAKPLRKEMRFCSSPDYMDLLKAAGVDMIELTGNHLLDWGPVAFTETLDLYEQQNLPYYGGGRSDLEAGKPLLLNVKGNQLAFIGCNVAGPINDWATADRPGAWKCDPAKIEKLIGEVVENGYLPVVSIQHSEVEDFAPLTQMKNDFWRYAEAGAVVVSGSQAHFPQGFDFVGQSFVHYGLGNLFFDQMNGWLRKSSVDVHYFYQGRYINNEIIGIMNENYGQPRLMTSEESKTFFDRLLEYSFYYPAGQK